MFMKVCVLVYEMRRLNIFLELTIHHIKKWNLHLIIQHELRFSYERTYTNTIKGIFKRYWTIL